MQGGHHPNLKLEFYEELFAAIKARYPVYLHALSASELDHICKVSKVTLPEVVRRLSCGRLGFAPRAVGPRSWWTRCATAFRLSRLRPIAGLRFTRRCMAWGSKVPPPWCMASARPSKPVCSTWSGYEPCRIAPGCSGRLFRGALRHIARPCPTSTLRGGLDYLKTISISRLYLDNIRHIDAGWLTEGQRVCQMALMAGADDIGGLVMDDRVISATGVEYQIGVNRILSMVRHAGRIPALRDTEYHIRKVYEDGEWEGTHGAMTESRLGLRTDALRTHHSPLRPGQRPAVLGAGVGGAAPHRRGVEAGCRRYGS